MWRRIGFERGTRKCAASWRATAAIACAYAYARPITVACTVSARATAARFTAPTAAATTRDGGRAVSAAA